MGCFFFFKQKTAYDMSISDWSSDVCSSDLPRGAERALVREFEAGLGVAGVDVQALGFGLVPLAVDAGVRLLRLHALVIEPGMVEVDLGGAAGHVEPVFGAAAPVLPVDGREARDGGGGRFALLGLLPPRQL